MEDLLKNIPTIILSELPKPEREKYFKFLLENEVQFTEDGTGFYTAIIKVINSRGNLESDPVPPKSEKSRLHDSTFSYKQKMVVSESPNFSSPNLSRSMKSVESKSKSPMRRPKTPSDYSPQRRVISDLLDQDSTTRSNPALNSSRTSARTPEKLRPDPLKLFLQSTKFQDFIKHLKAQPSSHLRPKTLSITVLMKTIEEIYSARYKKETSPEERSKRTEDLLNDFPMFVAEFFIEKYKNKRMVEQSAFDFCQSIETYDVENTEIRVFSQFFTGTMAPEILVFFLYVRHTTQSVLGLQLIPKFAGQKLPETRLLTLNYKQCVKVVSVVFAEEESLQKNFISGLDVAFTENTIRLYDFLSLFVESYKSSLQGHSGSLSPFHSELNNDTLGDSLMRTESEGLRSTSPLEFSKNTSREPAQIIRPLPRSPFDRIKELCIEHCEGKLVVQFVKILLSGHLDEYSFNKNQIISEVEEFIIGIMSALIDALCRCDKRKWMEILQTDNKDCLKHCENLQKRLREVQKKAPEPSNEDIDQICKEILQTSELKAFISEKIREIC